MTIIRRAVEKDAEAILACLRSAFQPYQQDYTTSAYEDTVLSSAALQERRRTMTIFVAETDSGQIVGTIACSMVGGGEGHLRGMAVFPHWQGKGVSQQLLESAERELQSKQCRVVTLDTTQPLQRAIRFYESNGYRASGKVGDFYGMPLYEYEKQLE